jgi:hypothetical protein
MAEAVERGASGAAIQLDRKSAARWSWEMSNGASHNLELQLEDNWLLFIERPDASFLPISAETLWAALRQNAASLTEIKIAVTPMKRLSLRSEILLPDEVDAEQRVRGVIEAFQMTWDGQLPPPPAAADDWATEVERRCEESGWSCVRRSSGRLTVALATTPAMQATVSPAGSGLRLGVEVADFSAAPAVCRAAAAALALETSGRIRMVRVATDESQTRIQFEICFVNIPSAEELAAGYSGLSAAVALAADALGALQNEDLARDYLTIRGWPAAIQNQQPERTNT